MEGVNRLNRPQTGVASLKRAANGRPGGKGGGDRAEHTDS